MKIKLIMVGVKKFAFSIVSLDASARIITDILGFAAFSAVAPKAVMVELSIFTSASALPATPQRDVSEALSELGVISKSYNVLAINSKSSSGFAILNFLFCVAFATTEMVSPVIAESVISILASAKSIFSCLSISDVAEMSISFAPRSAFTMSTFVLR